MPSILIVLERFRFRVRTRAMVVLVEGLHFRRAHYANHYANPHGFARTLLDLSDCRARYFPAFTIRTDTSGHQAMVSKTAGYEVQDAKRTAEDMARGWSAAAIRYCGILSRNSRGYRHFEDLKSAAQAGGHDANADANLGDARRT